jgi:hypothetical protein
MLDVILAFLKLLTRRHIIHRRRIVSQQLILTVTVCNA